MYVNTYSSDLEDLLMNLILKTRFDTFKYYNNKILIYLVFIYVKFKDINMFILFVYSILILSVCKKTEYI